MKKQRMQDDEEIRLDSKSFRRCLSPLDRILFDLKVYGKAFGEKEVTREITLAQTLLKLPYEVRKKSDR